MPCDILIAFWWKTPSLEKLTASVAEEDHVPHTWKIYLIGAREVRLRWSMPQRTEMNGDQLWDERPGQRATTSKLIKSSKSGDLEKPVVSFSERFQLTSFFLIISIDQWTYKCISMAHQHCSVAFIAKKTSKIINLKHEFCCMSLLTKMMINMLITVIF